MMVDTMVEKLAALVARKADMRVDQKVAKMAC